MVHKYSKWILLSISLMLSSAQADFDYAPPGSLEPGSGTGRQDSRLYLSDMRFPIEKTPAFANSQVYRPGGLYGTGGGQCDRSNYSYPWRDNYCESRSHSMPLCPAGRGHQGQDIRPATCRKDVHWTVAAETGTITNIGSYSVWLVGDSGVRHRYLHLNMNRLAVTRGQRIQKGQRIGLVSNSFNGTPTTIHLHYDMYSGGRYIPTYMSLVKSYQSLLNQNEGNQHPDDSQNTFKRAVTASTADFDGDGYDDIYWYRSGAATDYFWFGQAEGFSAQRIDANGEFTPIAGDFNGDGLSDIFWYRRGTSYDYLWLSEGRQFLASRRQIIGDYHPIAGDFDGNGVDDIFWYRPGTGQDVVFYGNLDGNFTSVGATVNESYTPIAADYNGDGQDEIFWYRPGPDTDEIWRGKGTRFVDAPIQITGTYDPIAGDFNGDGMDDIFWYAAGAAADHIAYSNGTGFRYADRNSVPIVGSYTPTRGDFNGDGITDLYWYKPQTPNDDWVYYGTIEDQFRPSKSSVAGNYLPVP